MSWTDLFINNAESQGAVTPNPSETKKPTATSFPTNGTSSQTVAASFPTSNGSSFPQNGSSFPQNGSSFPQNVAPVQPSGNRFLNDIVAVYDKGFVKLNQPGYDFFEFFKMVSKGGIDNPQVYGMALEMAQSVDNSVNKASLILQSDYYITELQKLHESVGADGTKKMSDLTANKGSETITLTGDIDTLKKQLELLSGQLRERESALAEIDNKYQPKLSEIAEKLAANDTAKDMIISSINKVKNNIQNNLN